MRSGSPGATVIVSCVVGIAAVDVSLVWSKLDFASAWTSSAPPGVLVAVPAAPPPGVLVCRSFSVSVWRLQVADGRARTSASSSSSCPC